MDAVRWQPNQDGQPLPGRVRLLDQTRLPEERVYLEIESPDVMYDAIQRLVVRGAPAIGCAAAYGLAAAMQAHTESARASFCKTASQTAAYLSKSRPTAVNLDWALNRCLKALDADQSDHAEQLLLGLWQEADAIFHEDVAMCKAIGEWGAPLIQANTGVLTHCNAGALATSDHGTALSPMYTAASQGKPFSIYTCETRPLLQGSRLTAWELQQAGLDPIVICDNMAAALMAQGDIQLVITGADRVAANGDAANKIGTLSHAIAAKHFGIPFYIAAPYSTFDFDCPTGAEIPIEERDGDEITNGFGKRTAPKGIRTRSPAFDVTPAELITGYVTEKGIQEHPPTKPS